MFSCNCLNLLHELGIHAWPVPRNLAPRRYYSMAANIDGIDLLGGQEIHQ